MGAGAFYRIRKQGIVPTATISTSATAALVQRAHAGADAFRIHSGLHEGDARAHFGNALERQFGRNLSARSFEPDDFVNERSAFLSPKSAHVHFGIGDLSPNRQCRSRHGIEFRDA
jgi:hypothetical protein